MVEIVIVSLVVAAAAVWVGRRALRSARALPARPGAPPPRCSGCSQPCGTDEC